MSLTPSNRPTLRTRIEDGWGCLTALIFASYIVVGITISVAVLATVSRAIIIGATIVLVWASGLFVFRRTLRACYGLFEIISGLVLAGYSIARAVNFKTAMSFGEFLKSAESFTSLLGLLSSAYIIVRGLDNIDEAVKAHRANSSVQHCK